MREVLVGFVLGSFGAALIASSLSSYLYQTSPFAIEIYLFALVLILVVTTAAVSLLVVMFARTDLVGAMVRNGH